MIALYTGHSESTDFKFFFYSVQAASAYNLTLIHSSAQALQNVIKVFSLTHSLTRSV